MALQACLDEAVSVAPKLIQAAGHRGGSTRGPAVLRAASSIKLMMTGGSVSDGQGYGGAAAAEDIPSLLQPLIQAVDTVLPRDVGIKPPSPGDAPPVVEYEHIFESDAVSVGIFVLPPGGCLPLHDHPGMSVVSRVLYGEVIAESYDLVEDLGFREVSLSKRGEATLVGPTTSYLLPHEGNVHQFTAADDGLGCAFLDFIVPPYGPGRYCTYFVPVGEEESERYRTTAHGGFDIRRRPYLGPQPFEE